MNCDDVLEWVSASVDGALTPDEAARLQAHLDQCPRCRALQEQLIQIHRACGEMDDPPPADLPARILARLPAQRPAAKTHPWRRWGAMAAALALVTLGAWRLAHPLTRPATGEAPQVAMETTANSGVSGGDPAQADPAALSRAVPTAEGGAVTAGSGDAATAQAKETAQDAPLPRPAAADVAPAEAPEAVVPEALEAPVGEPVTNGASEDGDTDGAAPVALFEDAVPEGADAVAPAGETARPAPVADLWALSQFRAVITLEEGGLTWDYPRCERDDGETWYRLPADALEDIPGALGREDLSYTLQMEGEDLDPQAAYVLLVVPPAPSGS